jgi:glutamate 5-kinase
LRPQGYIVLDQGACKALIKGGKSLLPSGILEIRGTFGVGAPVKCLDENGNAIASGLSNYSASDLNKIKGLNTGQIEETLGYKDSDEAIHRDNLVIL